MCHIPFTTRINGRYRFRRRVHFRNIISRPVTISLMTADPGVARLRSAQLSARFVSVNARLKSMYAMNEDFLSGEQIHALFQAELRHELDRALAPLYRSSHLKGTLWQTAIFAEAYGIGRRLDRPNTLTEADETELTAKGYGGLDIEFIKCDLDRLCSNQALSDMEVEARLIDIDARISRDTIEMARPHILRARAEAYRRATHILDPAVQNAADPVQALLSSRFDHPVAAAELSSQSAPHPAEESVSLSQLPSQVDSLDQASPFVFYDARHFSAVIDDIVEQLRQDGTWSGDCSQQRRIMATFAWITGDKPLGAYNHLDVDRFKRGLNSLPASFRFGTATEGAMARSFDEVREEIGLLGKDQKRSPKTVNRDLSTMSTVTRHLTLTSWKPKIPNSVVLDFPAATIAIKDNGSDPRPPWTKGHLELLFRSPIFSGGGGAKGRLREGKHPKVWHDAAYWTPLLWYYHQTCREEMCGLRVDEINLDHTVPHFIIKDNDVRGRDGDLAGEKRIARRRALPLHPELLRLGFADYVRAIKREGHVALFPELYLNKAKRGGAQFYNVAWRYMVEWIGDRMALPRNDRGKGPDIHSIRALGSSFYEIDGVNEIIRADIMGHARTGTNAKHYSKRIQTEGLEVVLRERLEFILRYVPIITSHIAPSPVRLIPIEVRSRVGSGRARKMRRDAILPGGQHE